MICIKCQREIDQDGHPYHSCQAGMRGWYHWPCFVMHCHEVNEQGARNIKVMLADSGRSEGEGHLIDLSGTSALFN